MTDTSIQADETRLRILRAMPPGRRLVIATGWSSSLRGMICGGLKKQFATATEAERMRMLAERCLGVELAAKAYHIGSRDG